MCLSMRIHSTRGDGSHGSVATEVSVQRPFRFMFSVAILSEHQILPFIFSHIALRIQPSLTHNFHHPLVIDALGLECWRRHDVVVVWT